MKKHTYTQTSTYQGLRYDVTACGLTRQQRDGFQIDAALTPEEVTCKTCRKRLKLEPPKC